MRLLLAVYCTVMLVEGTQDGAVGNPRLQGDNNPFYQQRLHYPYNVTVDVRII